MKADWWNLEKTIVFFKRIQKNGDVHGEDLVAVDVMERKGYIQYIKTKGKFVLTVKAKQVLKLEKELMAVDRKSIVANAKPKKPKKVTTLSDVVKKAKKKKVKKGKKRG